MDTNRLRLSILIGSLALLGCGSDPELPAEELQFPANVLLITIDTLRADHLGCYGYERPTSPRIDQLAAESVVYRDAQATSSWTLPSLASLMTAVYPNSHGSVDTDTALDSGFGTLAERLAENGYFTGGIVSQAFASRRFGFERGFGHFDDKLAEITRGHELFKKTSSDISDKAGKWLEARAGELEPRPWFLWLHYFDPHVAYVPHAKFSESFGTKTDLDLYDGEIAWTDHHVGRVLDKLRSTGLDENTLIVLTSDHGEEFGDHGGKYHRNTLYREVLHVPLLFRLPERQRDLLAHPQRVVSLIDIAPTILALVDAPKLEGSQGEALFASESARTAVAAHLVREDGQEFFASIGDEKWILRDEDLEAFSRANDPAEREPLELEAERAAEIRSQLAELKTLAASRASQATGSNAIELSPAEIETLRALGYVGRDD